MAEKKKFQKPEMQVVELKTTDMICTCGCYGGPMCPAAHD